MISRVFERTLLESITIRFERQELLQELEVKKEEAERANREKSVLLASASHDLRQPMHAIGLYLDSLISILNTQEQNALGKKIALSVESLTTLFDSILDISKLDSGIVKPIVESINVQHILDNVHSDILNLSKPHKFAQYLFKQKLKF